MPQDHRVLAVLIADRTLRVGMQIRPAHADGRDPHLHFTRPGVLYPPLENAELTNAR
jgi:hypothetical protein